MWQASFRYFERIIIRFWETAPYPSPKATFCPKWDVSVHVGSGKGEMDSFPETSKDPKIWIRYFNVSFDSEA